MKLEWTAETPASPEQVWPLLAEPARWHRWAPHLRGGRGLGEPEVTTGARGHVRVGPGVPLPVRITAKAPGRYWDWRVGPIEMRHGVRTTPQGSEIRIEARAPLAIALAFSAAYGPAIALLIRNLGRVAAREQR